MTPSVSVIMPAYNTAAFIDQAVYSVLNQSWSDLELIVVDDGSNDGTWEKLEALAKIDSRIKLIHQKNSGRPAIARNNGLAMARGRYICFLDSDDYYFSGRLDLLLGALKGHSEWIAVFHDMQLVDAEGYVLPEGYLPRFRKDADAWLRPLDDNWYECGSAFFKFMSLRYGAMHTGSVLFDRTRIPSGTLIFDEQLSIGEDTDFWIRLALIGSFGFLSLKLTAYRQHASSMMRKTELLLSSGASFHEKNYARIKALLTSLECNEYRQKIGNTWFELAYLLASECRFKEARGAYWRSFCWSSQCKPLLGMAKTFLPNYFRARASELDN